MPVESSETYVCTHCKVRVTVTQGEEPKPWLRDREGRQIRQDSREPTPWLLKLGEDGEEDLCPVCAEHFRKRLFPVIDDAGSFMGPVTRIKIRVADLLHALAEEWDDQIESWPVEGAGFDINTTRAEAAEAAAKEAAADEDTGDEGEDS